MGGQILGDASTVDGERFDPRPRLPGDPGDALDDPRVLVLSRDLRQVLVNVRIGGTCSGDEVRQDFGSIALSDGVLTVGGTTCAPDLATRNPVQSTHGGGQDGMLAIVRLYRLRSGS